MVYNASLGNCVVEAEVKSDTNTSYQLPTTYQLSVHIELLRFQFQVEFSLQELVEAPGTTLRSQVGLLFLK